MFHAGNFPQMKNPDEELKMRDLVLSKGYHSYNRLLAFYYSEDAVTVINTILDKEESE